MSIDTRETDQKQATPSSTVDQVDAAGLLALGRDAGAGAAADDRLAAGDHLLEAGHESVAVENGHVSTPCQCCC